jgi:glucose-6-phosphate 1-dehydrogenase
MSKGDGWTRIIVEKPFGHDLDSCNELTQALAKNFDESHLYRIGEFSLRIWGRSGGLGGG